MCLYYLFTIYLSICYSYFPSFRQFHQIPERDFSKTIKKETSSLKSLKLISVFPYLPVCLQCPFSAKFPPAEYYTCPLHLLNKHLNYFKGSSQCSRANLVEAAPHECIPFRKCISLGYFVPYILDMNLRIASHISAQHNIAV